MSFKFRCDDDCRSPRCPAALERIAAGWRNGREITPGVFCLAGGLAPCTWSDCQCEALQRRVPDDTQ